MCPFKRLTYLVLCLNLALLPLWGNDLFNARIYPDGEPDRLAYTHSNTVAEKGDSLILDHFYFTPDGELYVLDRVITVKDEPVFNSLTFYQIDEYSSFTRRGDQAELYYRKDGKEKTVYRDIRKSLVFAPTQQEAIRKHLPDLLKGKDVTFDIFASEVLRLVEMKVEVTTTSPYDRRGCIVLVMHPKSMFIDWFVDEVYYVVEISTGHILEMHGFSTLRQKVDDKWEFKDMDFYYTYD